MNIAVLFGAVSLFVYNFVNKKPHTSKITFNAMYIGEIPFPSQILGAFKAALAIRLLL